MNRYRVVVDMSDSGRTYYTEIVFQAESKEALMEAFEESGDTADVIEIVEL